MWFSRSKRTARREAEAQAEREHQADLNKRRSEVNNADPYTFAVEMGAESWRWQVLYLHVGRRGLTYSYCPVPDACGEAATREAAYAAGRAKCEQFTQAKRWRDQREYFRLSDPVTI